MFFPMLRSCVFSIIYKDQEDHCEFNVYLLLPEYNSSWFSPIALQYNLESRYSLASHTDFGTSCGHLRTCTQCSSSSTALDFFVEALQRPALFPLSEQISLWGVDVDRFEMSKGKNSFHWMPDVLTPVYNIIYCSCQYEVSLRSLKSFQNHQYRPFTSIMMFISLPLYFSFYNNGLSEQDCSKCHTQNELVGIRFGEMAI